MFYWQLSGSSVIGEQHIVKVLVEAGAQKFPALSRQIDVLELRTYFCYNQLMISYDPLSDTSPEAEAVLISLLRRAPAWRKFEMVSDLNAAVKEFALAGIHERHPNATDGEVNRHLADILLGEDLAAMVYGAWDEFESS